jgi:hypothetical protein
VGLLPPDIDTALRIDTKKAGVTLAFFVRVPEQPAPRVSCCVHFECVKKIFRAARNFSS